MAVRIQDANGNAITSTGGAVDVNVKSSGTTQPVSGTVSVSNLPATQPVSATALPLPTGAALESGNLAAIKADTDKIPAQGQALAAGSMPVVLPVAQITTLTPPAAITNFANESGGNLAAIAASMTNGTAKTQTVNGAGVSMDVTVKGTQGTNFAAVQQPKDSGRVPIALTLDAVAGVAAEALATMTINKPAGTSTGTQYTVSAGKTFRVQSIFLSVRASAATLVNARVRLRSAASVAVASPMYANVEASTNLATIGATNESGMSFPDGLEFAAGQQVGLAQIASATSALLTVTVVGYEY